MERDPACSDPTCSYRAEHHRIAELGAERDRARAEWKAELEHRLRYHEALERIAGSSCFGKATGTDAAEWVDHQAVARQALTESGWVDPQRVRDFQAKEAK